VTATTPADDNAPKRKSDKTKKSSAKSPKEKKIRSVLDATMIFDRFLHSMLEEDGWTILCKRRKSSESKQVDRYFMPPGVTRGAPYKPRVDYFDSFSQLWNYLRSRTDDAVGQKVLSIYFMCKSILRDGFDSEDDDVEVRAAQVFEEAQKRIEGGDVVDLDKLMPGLREKKSPAAKTPSGTTSSNKKYGKRIISNELSPVNIVRGARRRRTN